MPRCLLFGALLTISLALTACAYQPGPPASGADSSSPQAVQQAHGGDPGGGSNVFNRQLPLIEAP